MTSEQIDNIIQKKTPKEPLFTIRFKTRNAIKGLFIQSLDYNELSNKNFWRIVSEGNIDEYKKTKDGKLARIFNGTEFTKLEPST